jgi:hypothetical protein
MRKITLYPENLKEKECLEGVGMDQRIIFRLISRRWVRWIGPTQNTGLWQVLVTTVMNLLVGWKVAGGRLSHWELWSVETFGNAAWRVTRLPAADLLKAVTRGWEFTVHSITSGKTSNCSLNWLWKAKEKCWVMVCKQLASYTFEGKSCVSFFEACLFKWENRGYSVML